MTVDIRFESQSFNFVIVGPESDDSESEEYPTDLE